MNKGTTQDQLLEIIDRDRRDLVELCLELANIPSPHGKERPVGQAVVQWLKAGDIEASLQSITDESVNAVGFIAGSGGGSSLILNAHMDTGPELAAEASAADRRMEGGWVDGDLLYGSGLINDKAQLCAFMIAARAIRKAGVRLCGDLYVTGVAFETGEPSVDAHQGVNFPGEGFGSKWLIDRGVTADYCLNGETSGFGIVTGQCGAVWLRIRVHGRDMYTPRLERGTTLRDHPNVYLKMAHAVMALERWALDYEGKARFEFPGGTIIPKAQVVGVRGGPGYCDIDYDVRIVPKADPQEIKREIQAVMATLDFESVVSIYQYSRGYVTRNADVFVDCLEHAHWKVFGSAPPAPPQAEMSMWRDMNVFNEVGIPAVCYGPPRQREMISQAQNRAMKIEDLVAATKVYALTVLAVCEESQQDG